MPLQIANFTVLESEAATQIPDFLTHLPPATSITLVEIDLKEHVHEKTLKSF